MIDLSQLALFVQVVQAGSFAQAARRLGMPPTTLSRQVAQLEDRLHTRLLQRTTRKLTLTAAGRTLFDQIAVQIAGLHDAATALASPHQPPKGIVRVAAPSGFFDFFEMTWVAEFMATYPQVQLEFVLSDSMADFLDEGIDVAFRGSGGLADSSLVARKLASSRLALAASPAYLTARGTPRTLDDLAQHDGIAAAPAAGGGGISTWQLNGPDGLVQVPIRIRLAANTSLARRQAAEAGLGICLLPIGALQDSLASGRLVELLPGMASAPAGLFVVYPSRRHVPRAVTAFVDVVVKRLAPALEMLA